MIGWLPSGFWAASHYEFTSALVGQHKMSVAGGDEDKPKPLPLSSDALLANLRSRPGYQLHTPS